MIRRLFSSIRTVRTLTGMAASIALFFGYVYYSQQTWHPTAPKPVPQVLDVAVSEACQDVPRRLPEPNRAMTPTLLLPLSDDREGLFTERLRTALDLQGWYRPVEASLLDKTLDTVREVTGIGIDPSARSMQWTPAELTAMMHSAKAEAALRGSVNRLSIPANGPVEISLQLELWELSPTESVTATLISSLNVERPLPNSAVDEVQTSRWSKLRFYGAAFCVALVWPFAMIPWMRRAIRQDSNAANLTALLGMTAIPLSVFLAYLIWQGKDGIDIALQGVIAALFLFFYTAFVLNALQNKIK